MTFSVVVDWRMVLALGAVAVGIVFASKMDTAAVENVSVHVADAAKEVASVAYCKD